MAKKIIGIDLGTTNSLVAFYNGSESEIVSDKFGKITPSVVSYLDNGAAIVGDRAKELLKSNPKRTIYSVKRFMGKSADEIKEDFTRLPYSLDTSDDIVKIKIDDLMLSAPEISAKVLEQLKKKAEHFYGESIDDCVITVPAYFNDSERNATQIAGKLAGLNVLKIINEPTAAALAYGLDKKSNSKIVVYDFGGGTFDVSVLNLKNGIFEVLSTNGDTQLGGDDIDQTILEFIADSIDLNSDQRTDESIYEYLRQLSEKAKIELTNHDELSLNVSIQSISLEKTISINRDQFNQLILPIIKKTKRCVKSALKDADLSTEDIEEIIMVGGSTRIPYVREEVEQLFNKIPHTSLNPDEVVAIGASIQAGILAGEIKETVLLDICPLSLGLETMGGVVSKFIARNSKIPCFATETFTTHVDNQTAVSLHILQGEREFVKDCSSLGKFSLKGIEPAIAGVPRIEVKFQIDANGILNVSAVDEATGNSKEINVKPHIGLTDEIVEDMLLDSLKNIKSDMESRMTKDAMIEAEAVILATERQLLDFISLLEKENIDLITESIRELKKVVKEGTNKDLIIGLTEDLDKEAQKFAELIMNSTIKKVLTDKTIEDLQG